MSSFKYLVAVCCILLTFSKVKSQTFHFSVSLFDKDTALFNATAKASFLSNEAISRKSKYQIPITISDFPVNSNYLDSISKKGTILAVSKWFNTLVIGLNDSSLAQSIRNLPFVKNATYIGKNNLVLAKTKKTSDVQIDYGLSDEGIKQVKGNYLHELGHNGRNITIAVLDAGFINVNNMPDFSHLFTSNKILATKNFVLGNNNVYQMDTHGTQVLSVLASKNEGNIHGSAIDANYLLLITEDVRQENLIEEYLWLQGVEYADSLGADIINSSLGYNTFDNQQFNHTINELGQNSTLISKAAKVASEKGMLIVSSAGNEGEVAWKHLTFPADEELVLTVGAVDINVNKSSFSSTGLSSLTYYKPNVVALGNQVAISSSNGNYTKANGTSFSCPIISGLAACLWEVLSDKNNLEIKQIIEKSAHQFMSPDYEMGYGLPNFQLAFQENTVNVIHKLPTIIYPNPIEKRNLIEIQAFQPVTLVNIYNVHGQLVFTSNGGNSLEVQIPSIYLPKGYLFVELHSDSQKETHRIIIQ